VLKKLVKKPCQELVVEFSKTIFNSVKKSRYKQKVSRYKSKNLLKKDAIK